LMIFMGVYPRVFLDRSKASVEAVRARLNAKSAGGSFASTTANEKHFSEQTTKAE